MVTKREYLISKNLAKPGRGKFSAEAEIVIRDAEKAGMVFDLTPGEIAAKKRDERKAQGLPPLRRTRTAEIAQQEKTAKPIQGEYDAKTVRAWAEQTGAIEKGRRGKLPNAIINAYLASNKPVKKAVVKRTVVQAKSAVRAESVGWTYARRKATDPVFISEPLVAVTTCGRCTRGVAHCRCSDGPVAPQYLGGETLLLTRPSK